MLSGRKQSIFGSFQIAKILWNSKFSCHNGMLKKRGGKNQKKFLGVFKLPDKWKVSWKVPNFLSTMGCWKITLGQKPMKLGISQIARHLGNYNESSKLSFWQWEVDKYCAIKTQETLGSSQIGRHLGNFQFNFQNWILKNNAGSLIKQGDFGKIPNCHKFARISTTWNFPSSLDILQGALF